MMDATVGNRDKCGRCGARHGGNNHICPVHGAASRGCCNPVCNPAEWRRVNLTWNPESRQYENPRILQPGEIVLEGKSLRERRDKPLTSPREWTGWIIH